MPKVSVVIPTYNRLEFLKPALLSVEQQSFGDMEVIVLDDGSTDGTIEFLEGYQGHHPFRWYSFKRKERAHLRNYGVREAEGRYIAFLDDDDEWQADKIQKQVAFMEDSPQVDLVHCFTMVIDEVGVVEPDHSMRHLSHHRRAHQSGYGTEQLCMETVMFTSAVMVTKDSFISTDGFDSALPLLEDWDFYLRFSKLHQIAALPEELVRYRIHQSQSDQTLTAKSRILVAEKNMSDPGFSTRSYISLCIHKAEAAYILGDFRLARSCYLYLLRNDFLALFKPIWGKHYLFPHCLKTLIQTS